MLSYSVTKLDHEPILVIILLEEWNLREHMPGFLAAWKQALEQAKEPLYCIIDVHMPPLPGLEDIIWGANQGARGVNPVINHPNIREIVVVSTNPVLNLAAKGLRSNAFGNARVSLYNTLEEALAHARN